MRASKGSPTRAHGARRATTPAHTCHQAAHLHTALLAATPHVPGGHALTPARDASALPGRLRAAHRARMCDTTATYNSARHRGAHTRRRAQLVVLHRHTDGRAHTDRWRALPQWREHISVCVCVRPARDPHRHAHDCGVACGRLMCVRRAHFESCEVPCVSTSPTTDTVVGRTRV